MKVFIAAHELAFSRISARLTPYNHIILHLCEVDSPDDYEAVILGQGWAECPVCRNIRYEAVQSGKIIAYESDLDLLDLRTLSDPASSPRHEYRTFETPESILVQVKGQWFGLWHTVKEYRYGDDRAYARLCAEELIDKLTDY